MTTSPERQSIALQLLEMRAHERKMRYDPDDGDWPQAWDRDLYEYFEIFNGLSKLLNYARNLNNGGLVLDLGAGTTRGVSEISKSKLGQGLNFEATVLSRRPEIEENLGWGKTHVTSAERLKGIKENSVTAILAGKSLAYSAAPHLAIRRIDEVLVPGGVIKAAFKLKKGKEDDSVGEHNYQSHDYFTQCLIDLGYDVAVSQPPAEEIIVAIKPGAEKTITASELLRRDSKVIDILMRVDGHY